MNYTRYADAEALREAALRDVHREWLTPEFIAAITRPLAFLYECAHVSQANYCPDVKDIFAPLKLLKPADVKVVIIGQDPYPRLTDAFGIAFYSKTETVSLRNMKNCLIRYGMECDEECDEFNIIPWVERGVLLVNASFTTKEGRSGSHVNIWEGVLDTLLKQIPVASVALMFGRTARASATHAACSVKIEHLHPAERSGAFEKRNVFTEVNEALVELGRTPVNWCMHTM